MLDLLGLIGAVAFAISAIPQALHSYRTKSSKGMSVGFLFLWGLGEGCMLAYVIGTSMDPYLVGNYIANGLCLLVIVYYKVVDYVNTR